MPKSTYRILLSYDADRCVFVARAPELEHCSAEGVTRPEALTRIEEEIEAQIANIIQHGGQPTPPVDEEECPGEFRVKVSRSLHRELLWQAR
jgi:predicted RNase H-like HicB family nuclease